MVTTMTPSRCRGRARGMVSVWEREQRQLLQINNCLPGCSRAETLKILADQRLGDQQSTHILGKESIKTKWRQAGPHSEEPPQRQPVSGPKCLGRDICIALPSPSMSLDHPLSPFLSPSSSSNSKTGSSGSPSLEPITRPKSSYEASPILRHHINPPTNILYLPKYPMFSFCFVQTQIYFKVLYNRQLTFQ